MRTKQVPFVATHDDYVLYSQSYQIPFELVRTIFSLRRTYTPTFFKFLFCGESSSIIPYIKEEYLTMLTGASMAYNNQNLMGRALPQNDNRTIKINRFLSDMNCAIQFHPHYGMQIVEVNSK